MDTVQKKELLHLRVEQANEQMLDALSELADTLFRTWQPEVIKETNMTEAEFAQLPTPEHKRLTKAALNSEIGEAAAEYDRGEYLTLEEMDEEMTKWEERNLRSYYLH